MSGVRYALEYARKQEMLRKHAMRREEEGMTIRHPATDIINVLNPINHAVWWYGVLNPAETKERTRRRQALNRRRESRLEESSLPPFKKGKVKGDGKTRI